MKSKSSIQKTSVAQRVTVMSVLVVLSAVFLMPLFWTISSALKSTPQTMEDPVNAPFLHRMAILWVPQPQDTAKIFDKAKPLYSTKFETLDVKARLEKDLGNGKLALVIEEPTEFVGKQFEADAANATQLERTGPVYTISKDGSTVKVVALEDPKSGEARVALLEGGNAGDQLTVSKSDLTPVRHFELLWDNFRKAYTHDQDKLKWKLPPFSVYGMNSLLLVVLTVSGVVVSNAVVAYAFARLKWFGRDVLFAITLATMMIPFTVTMVPMFALFKEFGWIGTFRPLWIPAWFAGAFNIFLLRQFFRTIPFELSEAAKLDGCSEWQIFAQVVLPLARPALAVVALFSFLGVWNDFLGPIIYLQDQKLFTLAVGLNSYRSQAGGTDINLQMAASTIVIAPIIVLYFFTQKLFIQGIAATGLKG